MRESVSQIDDKMRASVIQKDMVGTVPKQCCCILLQEGEVCH